MALGDTIYIQLNQSLNGYGKVGDVLQVTETTVIEAMMANGLVKVVSGPGTVVPSNTVGELAYAENHSATVTSLPASGAATAVPGCVVVVPASTRPVWLEVSADFQLTSIAANNAGFLSVCVYETTSSPTLLWAFVRQSAALAGVASKFATIQGRRRLGSTGGTRSFALYCQSFGDGGTMTANVLNGVTTPSHILAEGK